MDFLKYEDKTRGLIFGLAVGDAAANGKITDTTKYAVLVSYALHRAVKFGNQQNDSTKIYKKNKIQRQTFLDTLVFMLRAVADKKTKNDESVSITEKVIASLKIQNVEAFEDCYHIASGFNIARKSLGDGGLMRSIPCCLSENSDLAVQQSKLTHKSNVSIQCVKILYDALNICLRETEKFQADAKILKLITDNLQFFEQNVSEFAPTTGKAADTLYYALESFVTAGSFEQGISITYQKEQNWGTLTALTGALLGVFFGFNKLPPEKVEKLGKEVRANLFLHVGNLVCDFPKPF